MLTPALGPRLDTQTHEADERAPCGQAMVDGGGSGAAVTPGGGTSGPGMSGPQGCVNASERPSWRAAMTRRAAQASSRHAGEQYRPCSRFGSKGRPHEAQDLAVRSSSTSLTWPPSSCAGRPRTSRAMPGFAARTRSASAHRDRMRARICDTSGSRRRGPRAVAGPERGAGGIVEAAPGYAPRTTLARTRST
jgi:hypothetical protein